MTADLQNTTVIDGFIIDIETGEVLGHEKQDFRVKDPQSADWVLEKIMDIQCERKREEIKLAAITENQQAKIKDLQRREDWLQTRFGPDLESFAREQLKDAKTKTWKGTFGKLSLRTVKGGLRVADAEQALASACMKGWVHAVKIVESFQISKLDDTEKSEAETLPGFEVKPDTETFKIETGVA